MQVYNTKVSVIMPTYNRCNALRLTLMGFKAQDFKNFEIVIVNDGGSEEAGFVVKEFKETLNIQYYSIKSIGRAGARNFALKKAKGRYIIFNDDDRIPDNSFVREHYQTLINRPDRVIIGHKKNISVNSFDKICDESNLELEKWSLGDTEDNRPIVYQYLGNELANFKLGWVIATTANLSYDRNGVENIWFDEQYIGWGVEDNDFAYELYRKGRQFLYLPDCVNYHVMHEKNGNYWEECKKNIILFCQKYDNLEVYLYAAVVNEIIYLKDAQEILLQIEKSPELETSLYKVFKYCEMEIGK